MERLCQDFGKESVNMFLVDFPYTFKGKNRVTANKWDLPVDIERFFELASQLLTDDGCIALTATNPFSAYVVNKIIEMDGDKKYKDIDLVNFKYECIWEKELKTSLGSGVNKDSNRNRVEKLFIHKSKI
jgi:hypothetical protein